MAEVIIGSQEWYQPTEQAIETELDVKGNFGEQQVAYAALHAAIARGELENA